MGVEAGRVPGIEYQPHTQAVGMAARLPSMLPGGLKPIAGTPAHLLWPWCWLSVPHVHGRKNVALSKIVVLACRGERVCQPPPPPPRFLWILFCKTCP